MGAHVLDEAIALAPAGDDAFEGRTHPEYQNFIGPYGGITAAQALNAVLQHPRRAGEPVAFTINYAAALADGAFTVRTRLARNNRSTQHWIVEIVQQGDTVVSATALTATRRDTWGVEEVRMPQVPPPDAVAQEPARPVAWLRHYERRFIEGDVPAAWDGGDSGATRTRVWLRDRPQRPLDFASLTAMADNFFPRIWMRRATQVPVGTVTMSVYYHAREAQLRATGAGYLLGQAQGQGFGAGFFDHAAQLWNEAGALLATTHQVVYYKE